MWSSLNETSDSVRLLKQVMTLDTFSAGNYSRQNAKKQSSGSENFNDRVSVTEGTTPQSRSRLVESNSAGNVHRSTVKEYVPHNSEHPPNSSAHRPEPSEGADLAGLKKHQQDMLTDRQKKRTKRKSGGG